MAVPDKREKKVELSDEEVALLIGKGDEEALTILVERYAPKMAAWSRSFLSSFATSEDIEEVVSDSFLYAWHNHSEFDPRRGSVGTWLWWITRARASSRGRSILREKRWTSEVLKRTPPDGLASTDIAESLVLQLDTRTRLGEALEILQGKYPGSVDLISQRFVEHFSHAEIADRLGITETAARVRLYRAMQRLKDILQKEVL